MALDTSSQAYKYYETLDPAAQKKAGTAYTALDPQARESFWSSPYSQQQSQINSWAGLMPTAPPPVTGGNQTTAPPPAAAPAPNASIPQGFSPRLGNVYLNLTPQQQQGVTAAFTAMTPAQRQAFFGSGFDAQRAQLGQWYGTQPPPGGGPAPVTTDSVAQEFRQQLMELLQRDPDQVNPNDPAILAQTNAYDRGLERARQQRREAMAERLAAQGIRSSGALDAEVASGYQDKGEASAANRAAVTLQELTARRQQFQQALQLGAGILSQDEEADLRRELAKLDAAVRRESIAVQESLGRGDLDLRRFLGTGQLGLGLLQTLVGNQNFNDRLGFDIGAFDANLRNNSLLRLLGG